MKIKEFFKNTKKTLGIKTPKDEEMSKINRLEDTLTKLIISKNSIKLNLEDKSLSSEERNELEEELQVYKLQIKKGEEILKRKKKQIIMTLYSTYTLENEEISRLKYFKEEGNLPFNSDSKVQMQVMMQEICAKLSLSDEYLLKKLEVMLKYELPFFATNRKLARNWMIENFIF